MKYGYGKNDVRAVIDPFPVSAQVDNVVLESCTYVSADKYEAIDFKWSREITDSKGNTKKQLNRDRMFGINEDTITTKPGQELEDAIQLAYEQFNTRTLHIAEAFGVQQEELADLIENAETFQEFANLYCKHITHASKGVKVWVKIIRDKGFPKLPRFPRFVQPMSDEQCTLKYTNWELDKLKEDTAPSNGVHEEAGQDEWVEEPEESDF